MANRGRDLSNDHTSFFPASPSSYPDPNSNPYTDGRGHSPEAVTVPSMTLSVRETAAAIHCLFIRSRVYNAPKGGAKGRHHGNNAPICAEILGAPDYGDYDWS